MPKKKQPKKTPQNGPKNVKVTFNLEVGLFRASPIERIKQMCADLGLQCQVGPGVGFWSKRYKVVIIGNQIDCMSVYGSFPDLV